MRHSGKIRQGGVTNLGHLLCYHPVNLLGFQGAARGAEKRRMRREQKEDSLRAHP
jgi:hypothetical protein